MKRLSIEQVWPVLVMTGMLSIEPGVVGTESPTGGSTQATPATRGTSSGNPDPPRYSDAVASLLDSIVPAELSATSTPGAAVAVVVDDRVVIAKAYGVASTESGAPVTPDMLFRVASTTKMLTAAAALAAREKGLLVLDSPVGIVVPGLAPAIARLTPRDLLRHRAGLREGSSYYGPQDEAALLEFVRSWQDSALFTDPGDVYSYSNLGYVLMGAAIEKAAGVAYADAMRDLLFAPLGMTRTTLRPTEAMTYPLAQGHDLTTDGKVTVVRPFSNDVRYWPAGSVFTSANEFARFVIAVLNGGRLDGTQALPEGLVDTLLARQTDVPGYPSGEYAGYAMGLVIRDLGGVRMLQHGGVRVGFASLVRVIPEHRIGIVILANRTNGLLTNTLERVTALLVPLRPDPSPVTSGEAKPLSRMERGRVIGRYLNTSGELELEVLERGGKVWLRNPSIAGAEAVVAKLTDGRYRAGGQTFSLVDGSLGRAHYLFIAGHALRRQ